MAFYPRLETHFGGIRCVASDDEAFAQFAVIGKTLGQFRVRGKR